MLPRLGLVRPHLGLLQPLRQPAMPPDPRRLPLGLGGSRLQLLRPCMRLRTRVQLLQALEFPARLPTTTPASSRAPLQRFPSPLPWRTASSWLHPEALLRTKPWTFPTVPNSHRSPAPELSCLPGSPSALVADSNEFPRLPFLSPADARAPPRPPSPFAQLPSALEGLHLQIPSPSSPPHATGPRHRDPAAAPKLLSEALRLRLPREEAPGLPRAPSVQTRASRLCSRPPGYPLPTLAFSFGQPRCLCRKPRSSTKLTTFPLSLTPFLSPSFTLIHITLESLPCE